MAFSALLFDLDGTLIDSEPSHKKAEVIAFREFGIPITAQQLEPYMGTTLPALLKGVGEEFGKELTVEEFLAVEQPILAELIWNEVQIFEDAIRFVEQSFDVPRAMVTSSMKWYVAEVVARFPILSQLFEVQICQADVAIGKPHPEGYLKSAKALNVDPAECLVIEDSVNGVNAGLAAGCKVVGVDRHESGLLSEATWVVPNLNEPYLSHVGIGY